MALACAAHVSAGESPDSLHSFPSLRNSVREALTRYGRDPIPVGYGFEAADLLNPGDWAGSGWDRRVREAWVYDPESRPVCREIKGIRPDDSGWRGFITDSEKGSGNTTDINGWEVFWGSGVSDSGISGPDITFTELGVGLDKSGDTVYGASGGYTRSGGSISRISCTALYFDGMEVYPEAEKHIRDSIVYEDNSGNRLGCDRTSSLQIVLKVIDGSIWQAFAWPEKRIRTVRCEKVPTRCPADTGEIIRGEINKRIDDYRFTIRDYDDLCHAAVFRSRAECKRYGNRCAKREKKGKN